MLASSDCFAEDFFQEQPSDCFAKPVLFLDKLSVVSPRQTGFQTSFPSCRQGKLDFGQAFRRVAKANWISDSPATQSLTSLVKIWPATQSPAIFLKNWSATQSPRKLFDPLFCQVDFKPFLFIKS